MKNAATPPKTKTTTPNRLKMPQFIPSASFESDRPKQAAQASAGFGAAIQPAAAAAAHLHMTLSKVTGN
jgi:hypothetical protein